MTARGRGSHAETAHGNQNVAPARGVVREEQRKKSTVCKKEVTWQNVAAREHVGQLKALSSISENRWCEIRRRAGDVWAKKKSGGERSVAKEEGARCEGRCEGVEGMQ